MVPNFRFNGPNELIFERIVSFTIVDHLLKFHQNWSRTFGDKSYKYGQTHRQTDRHTDTSTPMKLIPVQKQGFWARLT